MASEQYVTLKDGRVMPVEMLKRLWAIEGRGVRFELLDDRVYATPGNLLDATDRAFLAENKAWIVSILSVPVEAPA